MTFAREAKPPKIPGEESWLACVYVGLSLCRERWKCFQLQVGFLLSGWTSAACTCCLSQRRERWGASSRERGQVGNSRKQFSRPNSRKKNVICCRKSIAAPVEVFALALTTWTSSFASTQILFMTALSRKARMHPCLQALLSSTVPFQISI